ncbi:hypothetical protein [Priestia megaterium]|uniref:hypothetical protein n=1 Tax=Priestia megaterium TaxID=1404 RepID=UPI001864B692|nr:hypothetical protein [Priestia megaterium]
MEGKAKTPAGAEATSRISGRPRKAKSCTEIDSGVTSDSYSIIYPVCVSLDWIDLVMSQPLCFVMIHIKRYKLGFLTRQKGFSYVVYVSDNTKRMFSINNKCAGRWK